MITQWLRQKRIDGLKEQLAGALAYDLALRNAYNCARIVEPESLARIAQRIAELRERLRQTEGAT